MRPEDVGGTFRWRNLLVVFNSPDGHGPMVAFVAGTDEGFVYLKDYEGHILRMPWGEAEMKPFASLCSPFAVVNSDTVHIDMIMMENEHWRNEALILKRAMGKRWSKPQGKEWAA